ncbi:wax ester/triacylglycerol synthase domain-containing protein [Actinospongicola halichondriae]|uniref:wax ester/triacylglycerol synthase domain-containing protein n=1 Tax=Actinospongicola halichondriae TaxID=3236844 RepID=UPI003D37C031
MAREREMSFERHMSDNEALMWNLEKDPALSSWFASITILDTVPSIERLRSRLAVAVADIARLRQRVVPSVGRLSPPMWAEDPEFDLDYHIRRMAVPSPGGPAELHEMAANLLLDPFERTRPLWQFVVIEGLEGGKAALFQKMHHTITDGEGGIRLAEKFTDFERDASHDDPVIEVGQRPVGEDFGESAREALGHNVRRVGGVTQRVVKSVVLNPFGTAAGVGAVVGEVAKTLAPAGDPSEAVGSPLWKTRSLKRWYGTIQIPFDDAKKAGKGLGGTINDFFVAGALAGSVAYHEARESAPHKLRVAMPVSTRKDGSAGGNQFSITTNELDAPTGAAAAFEVVRDGLADAKAGTSVDILGSLSMVINLLPTSVLAKFAKDAASSVDFTVSNVRGAPFEVYIAGAKVEALYPMGPIAATAFNLSMMSYAGMLDMGLVVDAGAVDEPEELRDHIEAAYRELIELGT